jgi:hypothetical protein
VMAVPNGSSAHRSDRMPVPRPGLCHSLAPSPFRAITRSPMKTRDVAADGEAPNPILSRALPKIAHRILPGTVCQQFVKCGRPNCRCTRGQLHGPYWYRFFRTAGRLRKRYVRQEDVEAVRAACDRRREIEASSRRDVSAAHSSWRELLGQLLEVERNASERTN